MAFLTSLLLVCCSVVFAQLPSQDLTNLVTENQKAKTESKPKAVETEEAIVVVDDQAETAKIEEISDQRLDYLFTKNMYMGETKGLTHWMLIHQGETLFAHNIVRNSTHELMKLKDVTAIAVDPLAGYLFVAIKDKVIRYPFVVDLGVDRLNPVIILGQLSKVQFFADNAEIKSLITDPDQSVLYVGSNKITMLEYAQEKVLTLQTSQHAIQTVLYPNQMAESMETNGKGDLFVAYGSQLLRMPSDYRGKAQVESQYFEKVQSLYYSNNMVYFAGTETGTRAKQGLYMKPVKHREQQSELIVTVVGAQETQKIQSMAGFDEMIYYVDQGKLYAVQNLGDGNYSQPRYFTVSNLEDIKSIHTFELHAVANYVALALLLLLVNLLI